MNAGRLAGAVGVSVGLALCVGEKLKEARCEEGHIAWRAVVSYGDIALQHAKSVAMRCGYWR